MISSLPTELQLMVAEFYFANPESSFYTKWCLSKRFDKHFGIKWFRNQLEDALRTPAFETITTGNPRLVIDTKLPRMAYAPCVNQHQNIMKMLKFYEVDDDYGVFSKRWLPCLGCQRNQECTQCPFEITTYRLFDIFDKCFYFMMDMTIHHPYPIEYMDPSDDDDEATVQLYKSNVAVSYNPKSDYQIIRDDIEELSFTKSDFNEVIERYNLHRYIV